MTLLLRGCASDAVAGCVALTLCEKAFSDNAPAWRCLTCKSLRLQAAKSQSGLMHPSKKALLVDHLVGEDVELRRDRHSERVGGLAIDHQVEFRRLLDRQVARLGALDNLVDERCGAAEEIGEVLAVAHQPAGLHVVTLREHRRQTVGEGELRELLLLSQ